MHLVRQSLGRGCEKELESWEGNKQAFVLVLAGKASQEVARTNNVRRNSIGNLFGCKSTDCDFELTRFDFGLL
jgi:hypothetical protein